MSGKWLLPWDKVLCPFCFELFHLGDAPLRPMDGVSTDIAPDEIIQQRLGDAGGEPRSLPRCVDPPTREQDLWRYLWNRIRLDNAPMRQHDRVCPHCHCTLPLAIGMGHLKSNVIAIIGEKSAGKSNYFASLIHELQHGVNLHDSGFSLMPQDTMDPRSFKKRSSQDLWNERYGRFILGEKLDGRDRRAVPNSHGWEQNPDVRTPLIYRLQFGDKHRNWWHRLSRPMASFRALDLVIYDTAGEDLEEDARVNRWLRYLSRANGLIFLIDPRTFSSIQRQPSGDAARGTRPGRPVVDSGNHNAGSRAELVIQNMLDLLVRHGVRTPDQTFLKPTAFALTKSDILTPDMIGGQSRIPLDAIHNDGFDAEDIQRVSTEVEESLAKWGEHSLLKLTEFFPISSFFAVSSLGEEPRKIQVEGGEDQFAITRLRPRRVLDPLLWMLHQFGYLTAADVNRS